MYVAPQATALISYDHDSGTVTVKVLDQSPELAYTIETMQLATFLREIGIPFKAVRAITSGERVEELPVA